MEKIQFGTRRQAIGISRANVADGVKARAILIDKNPRVKQIAWDDKRKRAVEVDQDAVLKYKLSPRLSYLFLIARLNTDMEGRVVGDEFKIEYLQLADSVYSEFVDAAEEMEKFSSIIMRKVSKGEFSYLKISPSQADSISPELKSKIKEIKANKSMVEQMWMMVDRATSMKLDEYKELLKAESGEETTPMIQSGEKTIATSIPETFDETDDEDTEDTSEPIDTDFVESDEFEEM